METKENLKERLKHQVMERMDISRTMEDEEILELVQKTLEEDSHRMPMSISMRQNLIREIFHSLRRLDILQELIEDADITEIMVNGTKGIFYEKAGRLYQWDKHFTSEEKLQDVIQQIAGGSNRMVNELHPIVDTRLPDGSRVNIVLKPIAIDGTALSIRRFPKEPVRMQTLIEWGSISMEVADFLKHLVCAGYNIFVSGGTGSGKTTLISLIPRFYDATEGEVLVDGVNVKNYKFDTLYDKLGYVTQKAVLFAGSIRENVFFGESDAPETDDELKNAIELSQAEEFVDKLPDGTEHMISQMGRNVSGGQKQRLSISRALSRKPEILVFDDSFSALDYKTDAKLREGLNEKLGDTTKIIVAQRISTIRHADKIIVLDRGEAVGMGTHEELMKNCDVYKEIALSQLSAAELA